MMTTSVGSSTQMFFRAYSKVCEWLLYLHEKTKVLSFPFTLKEVELHYGNEMCVSGTLTTFQ